MPETIYDNMVVKGYVQAEGEVATIESSTAIVYAKDQAGMITRATGPVVPINGRAGYAKGCEFIESDDVNHVTYINRGTSTSCAFMSETIRKTVSLTAAQIIAMYTGATNVVLVPAVTGKVIVVESILLKMVRTSTAFTGGGAVEFRYTDNSGNKVTADISATMITGSAGTAWSKVGGIEAEITPIISAPIIMTNASQVFAAGTGTGEVTITYHISG